MDGISQLQNAARLRLEHQAGVNTAFERRTQSGVQKKTGGFQTLLDEKLKQKEQIRFSKHASERMEERGIEMTEDILNSLNDAVYRAGEKGAKETLIIGSDSMYIVNVPNRVVVTTVNRDEMKGNIFTNIDSVVWI